MCASWIVPQTMKVQTLDSVMSVEKRTRAPEPTVINAMHAARLLKINAGRGTPREFAIERLRIRAVRKTLLDQRMVKHYRPRLLRSRSKRSSDGRGLRGNWRPGAVGC
ncbi:unnamed protein product [Tuber aestivum]|uniref:Uncharacterized protein n=1 Tax=Tuber aestivum TaxID=59557 RepID=A0A292Q701_9PEZI|nr:unnamed protein product [Tuber aestivum]